MALDTNILGNNSRPTPKSQTSGPDSYRQLCLVSISLVYAVSLPSLAGSSVPDRRRGYYCRVWIDCSLLFGYAVVVWAEE